MKNTLRRIIFFAVISGILLVSLAPASAATPRYGGTFIVGLKGDPVTLNGAITTDFPTAIVTGATIADALVGYDASLRMTPRLATTWEISPDQLTWTFHLRTNVKWHDGVPFTSADVKYSIEEVLLKYHPSGKLTFAALDHVETPDNYTVVLKLKYAYPPLFYYIGTNYGTIIPKHIYLGTNITSNPANQNPIGTGAYKFVEWVKGDHITFVRNPDYWGVGPYFDRVIFRIIPSLTTLRTSLETGEIDFLPSPSILKSDIATYGANPDLKVDRYSPSGASLILVYLNTRSGPLHEMEVRQAITMAINKTAVSSKAYFGVDIPASGPISSKVTSFFNPNMTTFSYNLAMAATLLDEAGYPVQANGSRFGLTLSVNSGDSAQVSACEIIKQNLKDVNIDITIEKLDSATVTQKVFYRWNFNMFIYSAISGPDPAIAIARFYTTSQIKPGIANCMNYSNPLVDTLFNQAGREINQTRQHELYNQIQQILVTEAPAIWLDEDNRANVMRKNVDGLLTRDIGLWAVEPYNTGYFNDANAHSPVETQTAINNATVSINEANASGAPVDAALAKLAEARTQLEAGQYDNAYSSALQAIDSIGEIPQPQPDYKWAYLAGGVAVITVVAIAIYWYMRRRE